LRLKDFTLKDPTLNIVDAERWETRLKGLAA
jgi:hypothetical protein